MNFIRESIAQFQSQSTGTADGIAPITQNSSSDSNMNSSSDNSSSILGMILLFALLMYSMNHLYQANFKRVNEPNGNQNRKDDPDHIS